MENKIAQKSSSKIVTYSLISMVFILISILGYTLFYSIQSNKTVENKIETFISETQKNAVEESEKVKKFNQEVIDEISQRIIDSMTRVYEGKLKDLETENSLAANITTSSPAKSNYAKNKSRSNTYSNTNRNTVKQKSGNTRNYSASEIEEFNKSKTASSKRTYASNSNVSSNTVSVGQPKSYNSKVSNSKVTNYAAKSASQPKKQNVIAKSSTSTKKETPTVSRTTSSTSNRDKGVALNTSPSKNTTTTTTNTSSVSQPSAKNTSSAKSNSKDAVAVAAVKKSNRLRYNNMVLDNAINIHDIESAPVFPGCENKNSEDAKKNCLATKVSNYAVSNFNSKSLKGVKLKKGINNVRVLFVIDRNGNSKATNIVGDWHPKVKEEVTRVIKSMPRMKPGKINNTSAPVKYSFRIPFIVK